MTAVERSPAQRSAARRTRRWVLLALAVIAALAALTTYLTAPRAGGRMDPHSTGPDGTHALVALLRDRGVDVVVADNIGDVERSGRPDSLLLIAQTYFISDDLLKRLAAVPGDRLLVEPDTPARRALSPSISIARAGFLGDQPNCGLPEAQRAGSAEFGASDTYRAAGEIPVTRCYGGALVRYSDAGRTVTVVGSGEFMTNSKLLRQGNAALAMNLAGTQPRLVWYTPQHPEGQSSRSASIFDLKPRSTGWVVWQLWLVVILAALWQGRRMGPLVAEKLPVVVRASETVEGRARLYRSRRARDRAADALRSAALQRMLPRLGLNSNAPPPAVVSAVAARCREPAEVVGRTLYGPVPAGDTDLVNLARELDEIERQVARS